VRHPHLGGATVLTTKSYFYGGHGDHSKLVAQHDVFISVRSVAACVQQLKGPCLGLQNAEVLSLTYGSIVRQLITDHEDMEEVNKQLDRM
jgi:hypothetical protein